MTPDKLAALIALHIELAETNRRLVPTVPASSGAAKMYAEAARDHEEWAAWIAERAG
jgi:hypothetical protein